MSEKTERNLALALASESRSSARDTAFAQKADHDANPLLARLFRALAKSESVHARRPELKPTPTKRHSINNK
jgi:rubrerythrin